ncbi:hypothetical protein GQ54DRAFT_296807 [Martensiomyces pterosporus]|nr:hypothetical protein GQ54DRAFT_296807 [Martensiomyces pterosporus]
MPSPSPSSLLSTGLWASLSTQGWRLNTEAALRLLFLYSTPLTPYTSHTPYISHSVLCVIYPPLLRTMNPPAKVMFRFGSLAFTRDAAPLLGVTVAGCTYGLYVMYSKFHEPGYLRRAPRHAYKNTGGKGSDAAAH